LNILEVAVSHLTLIARIVSSKIHLRVTRLTPSISGPTLHTFFQAIFSYLSHGSADDGLSRTMAWMANDTLFQHFFESDIAFHFITKKTEANFSAYTGLQRC
jgi:hypothetical protein